MTQELPPQPRKIPKQSRSQHMVSAILDSCQKILEDFGEESLTLPLLEKISGAGKGSIYQYFPNLSAIVASLYQRECSSFLNLSLEKVLHPKPAETLDEFLRHLIVSSVESHRKLRSLHSSFYGRYNVHYDIWQMYNEEYGHMEFIEKYVVPLIIREFPQNVHEDPLSAGVFSLQAIRSQYFAALEYYPDKIFEESFVQYLIDTGYSVLKNLSINQNRSTDKE